MVTGPRTVIDGFTIKSGWNQELAGGICCSYGGSGGGATIIENNVIRGNFGGGLYAYDPSWYCGPTLTVAGNVFVANALGSGIYCDGSSSTTSGQIANNTIICNWGFDGGGIYLELGCEGVTVSNNIIAFNVGGGVFYDYDPYGSAAPPALTNNDVYGNDRYLPDLDIASEIGGGYNYYGFPQLPAGDIQEDPQIPNIQWGDWHIAPSSPCRAAGATQAVVTDRDIDGNPREIDSCADIGAQECDGANPAVGPPIRIYVDTAGCDSSAGTSWNSAVATVQKGVDLASNAGGGEVWVAAGTYSDPCVELKPFVSLYGGFAGNETSLGGRNWQANSTILDGAQLWWQVVDAEMGGNVVLDGFIVTDVWMCMTSTNFSFVTAAIANNVIEDNLAGGITCTGCPMVSILDNTITENLLPPTVGGGIYCYGDMFGSAVDISRNTIIGNASGPEGGGIYCQTVTATIDANLIEGNWCDTDSMSPTCGGGLAIRDSDNSSITNNIFAGNLANSAVDFAGQGGGAIFAAGNTNLSIVNNTFVGNGSGAADSTGFQSIGYGGAVLNDVDPSYPVQPTATIANNIFNGNLAANGASVAFTNGATGTISYCDAYNQESQDPGYHYYDEESFVTPDSTCQYVDPQFSGPPYALPPGSSLHGAGSTDYFGIPWLLYQDIAGNPRPGPDGTTDMGAYENWTDLQAVIDVVAEETLIPADGLSETMVTAVVLDSSGNPVQNAAVAWGASDGDIFPAQTTTNSAGAATAILTSSTAHVMATVSATSGGVAGNAYVQFGYPYDPLIFITKPVGGDASGFVEVDVAATNADGSEYPMSDVQLCIDGSPEGSVTLERCGTIGNRDGEIAQRPAHAEGVVPRPGRRYGVVPKRVYQRQQCDFEFNADLPGDFHG